MTTETRTGTDAASPPALTQGRVWRLAGPIMLSNLTVPLPGLVDSILMGHLPEARYLAGVALGAMVFNVVYWAFVFLRKSTSGLTAQALGRRDGDASRSVLARALLLAGTIGLALVALQVPLLAAALSLVDGTSAAEAVAQDYVLIRIWGAPAFMANMALMGWFVGMQSMRTVLLLQILLNGLNVLLDLVFVLGLGMTADGVAAATVLAEYAALAAGLLCLRRPLASLPGRLLRGTLLEPAELRRLLAINRDIFIRTLCLVFALAFFTAQGARQGDAILAANAVLQHFVHLMAFGLDGISNAAEALVGQAVGARRRAVLRRAVVLCAQSAFAMSLIFALIYLLAGPWIVALFTDQPELRETATRFVLWLALAPPVAVWSFLFDGVFIGATRARDMRDTMLVSVALYLAAWALLMPLYGNDGLWAAFLILFAARGATLALRYPALEKAVPK